MSRVTDALKRARTGSVARSGVEDDRSGDPIQFFAPGQPAVVVPWKIGTGTHEPLAAAAQPRHIERDDPPSTPQAQLGPGSEQHGPWPSYEDSEKLVVSPAVAPAAREQYSKLAAALHEARLEHDVKVVMLTSARPGEGKSLTAANLALTFSESHGRRVLLVDADLRRPTVHETFRVSNVKGLGDCLSGGGPLPLIRVSPWLWLLTAGAGGGDPMKILTSERMRDLVGEARGKFDWVLIDTAPVGLLPDAKLLASMADVTVLVALAGKTPYDLIQQAAEAIGPERIFGVVLNSVTDVALPHSYYESYGSYGARNR